MRIQSIFDGLPTTLKRHTSTHKEEDSSKSSWFSRQRSQRRNRTSEHGSVVGTDWQFAAVGQPHASQKRDRTSESSRPPMTHSMMAPPVSLVDFYHKENTNYNNNNHQDELYLTVTKCTPVMTRSCLGSMSNTLQRRSHIRTNPWLRTPARELTTRETSTKERTRRETLVLDTLSKRTGQLEGSFCSSGYASHDSSPETSVHAPHWTNRDSAEIKARISPTSTDEGVMSMSESGSGQSFDSRRCPPRFVAPPPPESDYFDDDSDECKNVLHELQVRMAALHRCSDNLSRIMHKKRAKQQQREYLAHQPMKLHVNNAFEMDL